MADAAVEFLLENVKELITYNADLLGNARYEVVGLKNDLEILQGFILDSAQTPAISHEQQALLNSIRDVVANAEDAIDKFVVEKAKHNARGAFKRIVHSVDHAANVRRIAVEIQKIRGDAERITAQNPSDRLQRREIQDNASAGRIQAPIVEEDDVVGFDKAANEVICFLTEGSAEHDVIGIVGMAGLGKTTLANKVFKDDKIDFGFVHRAWVYVSKDGRVKDVFISILKKFSDLSDSLMNGMQNHELADEIRKCLKGKKYLIVLDDVWDTQTWDALKVAFPSNDKHSRILLTTRFRTVAEYANRHRKFHQLEFLGVDDSWELLRKKVFGKEECPSDLITLGRLVAEKCEGLPLAIVVIAGILLTKRIVKDWWTQVNQRVSELVNVQSNFNEVVAWSYNSLPYNKKLCFLYFGIFPRGSIPVWRLIRLWIAEGFIKDESRLGLENEATAWLDELVDRNLVMATSWGSNGRIQSCRVHDTLRDFCKLEAEKQKLYHEIDMSNRGSLSSYRRICIHSDVKGYISSKPSDAHVRTFLTSPEEKISLEPTDLTTILKAFEKVRVLEVSSIKFTRFPKELRQLALLRYLSFSSDFKSIPSSISSLWSLQTLIILTSKGVLEFEEDIWKLYQLRHLQTNASAVLPPPPKSLLQIGKENVQTLSTIAPECCTEEVFSRTPNIKKLGVRGKLVLLLETGSKLIENIGKLAYLTNLKLFNDATSSSGILDLSRNFPRKLTKLTLSGTSIDWDHMYILGDLEMLEVLKLKDNAFKGEVWKVKDGSFPALRVLYIDRTDLKMWQASDKQFKSLIRLVLKNCTKLVEVPSCLVNVHSFQNLDISNCCKSAVQSAKKLQEKKAQGKGSSGTLKLTVYPPDSSTGTTS